MTARTTAKAPHEPSAWLRQRIAERVGDARRLGVDLDDPTLVVLLPLGRGWADPGSREDRQCDRCGAYVDDGSVLYLARLNPRPGLVLVGGFCGVCAEREVPDLDLSEAEAGGQR